MYGLILNSRGRCAFGLRPHPHLTGLMRKFARLANFPNFFRFAPETSHKPDVIFNSLKCSFFYFRMGWASKHLYYNEFLIILCTGYLFLEIA